MPQLGTSYETVYMMRGELINQMPFNVTRLPIPNLGSCAGKQPGWRLYACLMPCNLDQKATTRDSMAGRYVDSLEHKVAYSTPINLNSMVFLTAFTMTKGCFFFFKIAQDTTRQARARATEICRSARIVGPPTSW